MMLWFLIILGIVDVSAQELNLENPTEEPFHRAITGAADLTGLRGVMVKRMDDGTGRVLVVGAGDSDFELPLITSLTHLYGPHQTPVHSPFSTRSTFEAWDRALIHETENCIQVSKIISLEMIEQ
ncbi:hypothetical protein A2U01_0022730, partial [Trifolium medium]|nr:hypothetical protein [Trifolium medium]